MSKEFSSIDIVIKWGVSLHFCEFVLVAFVQRWSNKATKQKDKDLDLTPPKFNMEPENDGFQVRNLLFQGLLFRFHVKFQGCISSSTCQDLLRDFLRSGLRECFTHRTPFWGEMLHLCWRMIPWKLLNKKLCGTCCCHLICVYEYISVSIYAPRI